jgi:sugar diacid utilization regulator
VALQEWHKLDPETFPLVDWANQALWRTPDENRAARELKDLESERTVVLTRLDERQQHLEAELTEAKRSADAHERRLLTAKGDDLVHVATECFTDLGFVVTNMDEVYPEGDRREDLRVTATAVPDWIALSWKSEAIVAEPSPAIY